MKQKWMGLVLTLSLLVSTAGVAAAGTGEETVALAYGDFSGRTGSALSLTNSAAADGMLRLTPSGGTYASGAYYGSRIRLGDDRSFSTFFTFTIGPEGVTSDGFLFHVSSVRDTVAASYGPMGVSMSENAFGIEFDTYQNGDHGDQSGNHIALTKSNPSQFSSVSELELTSYGITLSDNALKYAWVDYDGNADKLYVTVSNQNDRDAGATMTVEQAGLKEILTQSEVYAGFSSTVYSSGKQHDIHSWYFDNQYRPIHTADTRYVSSLKRVTAAMSLGGDGTAQVRAQVTDTYGNPVENCQVALDVTGERTLTDASGQASFSLSGPGSGEALATVSLSSGESAAASAFAYPDFADGERNRQLSLWGLSDSNAGYETYNVRPQFEDGKIKLNTTKWSPGYGAAYYGKSLYLGADRSFSTAFTFDIQGQADRGLAFVLSASNTTADKNNYDNTDRNIGMPKFGRNVMIELDTRRDSAEGDASAKHVGLTLSKDNGFAYVRSLDLKSNYLADGTVKYVWIDYDGAADTLAVTLSATADRSLGETMTVEQSGIREALPGCQVYAGFVSTIYDTSCRTSIGSWYLNTGLSPIRMPQGAVMGDINADGLLNAADLRVVKTGILEARRWEEGSLGLLDYNGDGMVDILDLTAMKRSIAALDALHTNEGKDMNAMFDAIRDGIADSPAKDNYYRFSISRNGRYRDHYFKNMSACSNVYSVSKAVTSTAVGLAYDRGLLNLDDPILDYLGDHLPQTYDPKLPKVTIRHLLSQTSGIAVGGLFEDDRYKEEGDDWIARMLGRELPYEPGTIFTYDNGHFYLLSCIVEKASGMSLDRFLQKYLFDEMDIHEFAWERCPQGHIMGATGLYIRIDDMNKIGQLYANAGKYNGKQLLSGKWVEMASTPYPNLSGVGYGFGFTIGQNGDFFCAGAHSQLLYISPANHTAVAVQGFDDSGSMVLDYLVRDAIW